MSDPHAASKLMASRWSCDPEMAKDGWRIALYEEPAYNGLSVQLEQCTSQSPKAQPLKGVGEDIPLMEEEVEWLRDSLTRWLEDRKAGRP